MLSIRSMEDFRHGKPKARFPFKRKRLRWQAANHGCHCFDRAFLLAGACVCWVNSFTQRTQRKRLRLNGNRAQVLKYWHPFTVTRTVCQVIPLERSKAAATASLHIACRRRAITAQLLLTDYRYKTVHAATVRLIQLLLLSVLMR